MNDKRFIIGTTYLRFSLVNFWAYFTMREASPLSDSIVKRINFWIYYSYACSRLFFAWTFSKYALTRNIYAYFFVWLILKRVVWYYAC